MRQIANQYTKRQKFTWTVLIVLFVLGVFSLVRNLLSFRGVGDRIVVAEQEVASLRQEYEKLQDVSNVVSRGEKNEEYIRDKLGLIKEGETVVVVPETFEVERDVDLIEEVEEVGVMPVWRQWLELFW